MILLRPVEKRWRITQRFGENPQHYPWTNGHNGIDIGLPENNPIRAAADGVVIRAELDSETVKNPKRGYGYHVRIQHADGSVTLYAHIREGGLRVMVGQEVRMGDVIGMTGNTGMSTGPHLHFELRRSLGVASCIDPEMLFVDEIPPESVGETPGDGESTGESVPAPAHLGSFTVEVVAKKTALQIFKARDKAGKPIMAPRKPPIRLVKGSKLLVSASRKESSKDKGDGIIHGTGNLSFYYVIDHPENGHGEGLYVKARDVQRVPA